MEYKIKFSKSARQDLNSIQEYICANNRDAARESSSPSPACPAPAGQPATALSKPPLKRLACESFSDKEVVAHILSKIKEILIHNPAAGRAGRVLRTRELVITKYPYIVPYQVRNDVVYILRVMHTSRKWQ